MNIKCFLLLLAGMTFSLCAYSQSIAETETQVKVIPLLDSGFIELKIISRSMESKVFLTWFDLEGNEVKNSSATISGSKYYGHAYNNSKYTFLFYDYARNKQNILEYNKTGELINRVVTPLKRRLSKEYSIINYTPTAYYSAHKKKGSFFITKCNFQHDTLWTKEIEDVAGNSFINNAINENGNLYIVLNSLEQSSRLLKIEDGSGQIHNMLFPNTNGAKVIRGISYDSLKEILIVVGEQFPESKPLGVNSGYFINHFDGESKVISSKLIDCQNLPVLFFKDFFFIQDSYYVVTENLERTDSKGEGAISGAVIGAITGVPLSGIEITKFTNFDLYLINGKIEEDGLSYLRITKQPITKAFRGNLFAQPSHYNYIDPKVYAFKMSINGEQGKKEIVFIESALNSSFTLGKASIDEEGKMATKTLVIKGFDFQKTTINFYQLSRTSILMQYSKDNVGGYNIIKLNQFL